MRVLRFAVLTVLPVLAVCLLTLPLSAEFYRYVDENGVGHYVDDLGKVPIQYRQLREAYQEKYDNLPEKERLMRLEQDRQQAESFEADGSTAEDQAAPREAAGEPIPDQAPAETPENPPVETKIFIRGDHVLVPVLLGYGGFESQALLLLDTGASIVSLRQDVADRLKLVPFRRARAQMADGKTVPYQLAEIDFIVVGPHRMENVMVGIYEPAGRSTEFDGLLGMNVVKNFDYTIDFSRQVIRWRP